MGLQSNRDAGAEKTATLHVETTAGERDRGFFCLVGDFLLAG